MTPLFLIRFLRNLGLGQGLLVIAILGLVLMYLFRGRRIAGAIAGLMGTAWLVAVTAGLTILGLLIAGVADPSAVVDLVTGMADAAGSAIGRWGDDVFRSLMDVLQG